MSAPAEPVKGDFMAERTPMRRIREHGCLCFEIEELASGVAICCCGEDERPLRAVAQGLELLDDEQREWCLREIRQVEGWDDYQHEDDPSTASAVLDAWLDYARDKGFEI